MREFITSVVTWSMLIWSSQSVLASDAPIYETDTIVETCNNLKELSKSKCRIVLECWWDLRINSYLRHDWTIAQMEKFINLDDNIKACISNKQRELRKQRKRERLKENNKWNPYKKELPKTMYT